MQKLLLAATIGLLSISSQALQQKIHIGPHQSRALWTMPTTTAGMKSPAILFIPGAGAHGPETMMHASASADGKDHSFSYEVLLPFFQAGIPVLSLGKPGVEFFRGWDKEWFYDKSLYTNLRWQQLVDNVGHAVSFLKSQSNVDPSQIYIMGYSEGSQVTIDYLAIDPSIRGAILLGYAGEDWSTIVEWQLYKRWIDFFVARDVDRNKDGFVSKAEASLWPEFRWDWQQGQEQVSYLEIENSLRQDPEKKASYERAKNFLLWRDVFARGPSHNRVSAYPQNIYVFTGALDIQTRAQDAQRLQQTCRMRKKQNCSVSIVPNLGHGFTLPKGPRRHPIFDAAFGPVDASFQRTLYQLGMQIRSARRYRL